MPPWNALATRALEACIDAVRAQGIVVVVGLMQGKVGVSPFQLIVKDLTIQGSLCYPLTMWPRIIDMVRSGLFPVEAMIDDEIEMTDVIEKGFKPLLDPQAAMMKILIRVGNGSLSARSTGVQARQGSEFEAGQDAVLAEVSGAPSSAALHRSDLAESRRGAPWRAADAAQFEPSDPLGGLLVGLCFGEDVHVTEELASWCYAGHNRGTAVLASFRCRRDRRCQLRQPHHPVLRLHAQGGRGRGRETGR